MYKSNDFLENKVDTFEQHHVLILEFKNYIKYFLTHCFTQYSVPYNPSLPYFQWCGWSKTTSEKNSKSWIWKHVSLIDKKYKCSYCEKSYVKNGTGVIQRHLRNKHNEKLKNMKSQQCTLTSTGKVVTPFKFKVCYLTVNFITYCAIN